MAEDKNKIGQARLLLLMGIFWFVVVPVVLADDSNIEAGEELYVEFCAGCHGDDKSGLSEYSADLASLTDRLEGVTEEMPDFAGFFEEDEIVAIHAYLSAPVLVGE